jgi:hypothetical protein
MGVSISESSGAFVIGFAMELLSTQQFQRQWEVIRDLAFVNVPPSKTVTAPGENGIYGCSDAPPRIVLVTLSSAVEAPETLDYTGTSFTRLGRAQAHAEVRVVVNKEDCGATEQRLRP